MGAGSARLKQDPARIALDHAAGKLDDAVYLDRLRALRESRESAEASAGGAVPPEKALAWLRALSETWSDPHATQAKAEVLHAIYEWIVVTRGRPFR